MQADSARSTKFHATGCQRVRLAYRKFSLYIYTNILTRVLRQAMQALSRIPPADARDHRQRGRHQSNAVLIKCGVHRGRLPLHRGGAREAPFVSRIVRPRASVRAYRLYALGPSLGDVLASRHARALRRRRRRGCFAKPLRLDASARGPEPRWALTLLRVGGMLLLGLLIWSGVHATTSIACHRGGCLRDRGAVPQGRKALQSCPT